MKKENMRTVGILVSIFMGLSISLVMSILGPLRSGHITVPAVLVSFLCSSIISILISVLIPIKKITDGACNGMHLSPEGIPGKLISAFISDLLFTPLISFLMIFMNYKRARMVDPNLSFGRMFFGNFIISFIAAYFIILVFLPLFIKGAIAIVNATSVHNEEEEGEVK